MVCFCFDVHSAYQLGNIAADEIGGQCMQVGAGWGVNLRLISKKPMYCTSCIFKKSCSIFRKQVLTWALSIKIYRADHSKCTLCRENIRNHDMQEDWQHN